MITINNKTEVFGLHPSTSDILTPLKALHVSSDFRQSQAIPENSEVHTHFPQEQFPCAGPKKPQNLFVL